MAALVIPTQRDDSTSLLHVRGQICSAYYTCPNCGKLMFAKRVNVHNGICQCTQCGTNTLLAICAYVLPCGPFGSQQIMPDQSLPAKDRTQRGLRRRSRKRRIEFLRSVGLEDPMLPSAPKRYCAGDPINRVVIVPEPPTSPTSDNVQSVKS